jgi:hypothetical protein
MFKKLFGKEKEKSLIEMLKYDKINSLNKQEQFLLNYTLDEIKKYSSSGCDHCLIKKDRLVLLPELNMTIHFKLSEKNIEILKNQGFIIEYYEDNYKNIFYYIKGW